MQNATEGFGKASRQADLIIRQTARKSRSSAAFHMSRWTIGVKLIGIISIIIASAMSIMILIASYLFSDDVKLRVQENNMNLTGEIGARTRFEFMNALAGAGQMVAAGNAEKFFLDHPEIIFAGTAVRSDKSLRFLNSNYNDELLREQRLQRADIDRLLAQNGGRFFNSLQGAVTVQNVSPGFVMPVLGAAKPFERDTLLLVLVDAEVFLKSFSKQENEHRMNELFMVDGTGSVIAHPDPTRILAGTSLARLKIVEQMLQSKLELGQVIYTDDKGEEWLGSYRKLDIAGLGVISTVRKSIAFENVFILQRNNVLILLIVLNLALIIVYFFSKTLTVPIRRLTEAANAIKQGQFAIGLQTKSRDEIGLLGEAMQDMARGLGEREKIKDAFGRFVNPEVAERALNDEALLGGEEKRCAILFSDIRGFTEMSEKLSPMEVVNFLNRYFQEMVNCVNLTHGIVDKFIGDAIMAHWGAFFSTGNDTENAVNAALLMRDALVELNKTADGHTRPFTRFGCGINTGMVVAGQIGSPERLEFTVIGDAVNLASRVESLNKPLGADILITEEAYRELGDRYVVEKMPAIKVKGKKEKQRIYAVIRRRDFDSPRDLAEVREMTGILPPAKKADEIDLDATEVKYEIAA